MSVATLDTTEAVGARRRRGVSLMVVLCVSFIALVVVMSIFGALIAPQNPSAQNLTQILAKPSSAHWLGTDDLGRDVFSRLIVGTRSALIGPLVIAIASMLIGNVLGLWAGYRGGVVDSSVMRWVDLMWAIPGLIVLIVLSGAVGGGYWPAVGILIVLTVPFDARIVRGATLEQTPRPYVEAARTTGEPDWRIVLFHIWPNVSPIAIANAFLVFAGSLVTLSALSYLGLGAPIGSPDWGATLAEGQQYLLANPVITLAPGLLIVFLATSMNLMGDWLYEWMSSRGATR